MRLFFVIFIFLFVAGYSRAQDTSVLISPSMFTINNEILIAPLDGWVFKEGNSAAWANENTGLTEWRSEERR